MDNATRTDRNEEDLAVATLPSNEPRDHYEIINDQIVVEPPLGAREGCIATVISFFLNQFVRGNRLGRIANEVLFILRTEPRLRRSPDVAFVSAERWSLSKPVPASAAWDVIPDLAIEVVSPTDTSGDVQSKIAEYFRAGVRLVWVVHPEQCEIYVYDSTRTIRVFGRDDLIDGGHVLPGFQMPLNEVFEVENRGNRRHEIGTDNLPRFGVNRMAIAVFAQHEFKEPHKLISPDLETFEDCEVGKRSCWGGAFLECSGVMGSGTLELRDRFLPRDERDRVSRSRNALPARRVATTQATARSGLHFRRALANRGTG